MSSRPPDQADLPTCSSPYATSRSGQREFAGNAVEVHVLPRRQLPAEERLHARAPGRPADVGGVLHNRTARESQRGRGVVIHTATLVHDDIIAMRMCGADSRPARPVGQRRNGARRRLLYTSRGEGPHARHLDMFPAAGDVTLAYRMRAYQLTKNCSSISAKRNTSTSSPQTATGSAARADRRHAGEVGRRKGTGAPEYGSAWDHVQLANDLLISGAPIRSVSRGLRPARRKDHAAADPLWHAAGPAR